MILTEGTRVGGYTIISLIGAGGMGEVYRAHQAQLERSVAIKVLSSFGVASPDLEKRFRREIEIQSHLSHPNLVKVLDGGIDQGRRFLVLELVEGPCLLELIQDAAPMRSEPVLNFAWSLLDALAYLHGQTIVHRDIKPGNVLFNTEGHAKLADFGLARGDNQTLITRARLMLGTPRYLAPEVVSGADAGDKADIHAIGVILYEMLTARVPYQASSFPEWLEAVKRGCPDPVGRHRPDLAPALQTFVMRLLGRRPAQRPSAEEALDQLHRLTDGAPNPLVNGAGLFDTMPLEFVTQAPAAGSNGSRQAPTLIPPPGSRPEGHVRGHLAVSIRHPAHDGGPSSTSGRLGKESTSRSTWKSRGREATLAGKFGIEENRSRSIRRWIVGSLLFPAVIATLLSQRGSSPTSRTHASETERIVGQGSPSAQQDQASRSSMPDESPLMRVLTTSPVPAVGTFDARGMIPIPAGWFLMGSNEGESDERPQRRVFLDAYWIDTYEVTNREYREFLVATGHRRPRYWDDPGFNQSSHPVVGVSWEDAKAYATWVGKRLPTEAEWEKAARGMDGRKYPWGNEEPDARGLSRANWGGWAGPEVMKLDGYERAAPVGSYPYGVSSFRVHDMAGNVWEWCEDWYAHDHYRDAAHRNPKGPTTGSARVLRGGAWFDDFTASLRCAKRLGQVPAYSNAHTGFRCAMTERGGAPGRSP